MPMMTKTEIGRGQRAQRNATYMAWSKTAMLMTSLLCAWPDPVRRHVALAVLAWGTPPPGSHQTATSVLPPS